MPAAGFHRKHPRAPQCLETGAEVGVNPHLGEVVIVEPGPLQALVIQPEPQRLHQVQSGPGVGAETNHIARIRRNLGFIQHHVNHGGYCCRTTRWVG